MDKEELIAPKAYNIASEMEQYAADPSRKALIWQDDNGHSKEITYANLMKNVNKIGNAFLEKGLKKGDKILIMVPRIIEAYEVYLAALKTGIIIIPSSEMLKTKDLQYRVNHGEVSGVVSYFPFVDQYKGINEYDQLIKFVVGEPVEDWHFMDSLKEKSSDQLKIADTSSGDIAFLPYTSGTTGNPKGVVHTHGWGFAHLKTAAPNWLSINEGDKVWATAGPGWQKWVWSPFLSVLGSGATGFVYNGKFDPNTYLRLLQDNEINVLCCTPTEYRIMAKVDNLTDYQFPALHSMVSAGEPLNVEVIDIFRKNFDITVRDGYGQTENTLLLGFMKGMEVKPGSMGKPTPGNEVEIIDEDGQPVADNEVGDIAVKLDSPALFREYYKDVERTKMSLRGNYYVTGDQALKDEDGYFWFEGRKDDIIISSGYTIGPFEVEDALIKHPSVQECAVIAAPDEVRGNIVKAFVVLKENVTVDNSGLVKELQDHVKQLTAPYKYPRQIEFIKELPKTTSGKIMRVELRKKEKQRIN
ncbi:acetyl-CoA synthetase [Virgibacillus natechei]|uniref:Acetyl-CoA synthetase n=1 Tax=Virgibacillus natechei TaxID=1216297 RepID=A0ABS4II27_9BACI|nr:acyl--CoA ligase [Virgibacillus natechei]MBP1970609.1 acetyl-CoA synthetase [Virgibacillus natechei]UZD14000.1 acyl--CoA ligase [Virgibacillus natechei]